LKRHACEALEAGAGLLLLDPHGDLADELMALVPRRRKNDVVWLDPRSPEHSPGLNPLRGIDPRSRTVVVSSILATLQKIWPDNWGPRTSHLLRYTLLALCDVRGASLMDARDVLTGDRRNWALKQVHDQDVVRFWVKEFAGYSKQLQADAVAAPLNKLGAFISHEQIRTILTKARPVLDAGKCMARRAIVIARLSKGAIGEDGAHLLGGLLLGAFQHATMSRERLPPEARTPFALLVDEVASFAVKPFVQLLSEARKYGVSVTLATQGIGSMEPELRGGILGNVGRLVAFRVGAEDAELLQKEFGGRFGPQALMSLDVGERIVKDGAKPAMLINAAS
jgi:hypothetical protein